MGINWYNVAQNDAFITFRRVYHLCSIAMMLQLAHISLLQLGLLGFRLFQYGIRQPMKLM